MLNPIVTQNLPDLIKIFEKYKIIKAYAFGSVCNNKFNEQSDIDLLISFQENLDPLEKGEYLWDMPEELKQIFNREIDLLVETSLKNPFLTKELNETKILIYG